MLTKSLLQDLISGLHDYQNNRRDALQHKRNFYQALPFEEAVKNPAIGMASRGEMDSHQYRIGKAKGKIAANEIVKYLKDIKECKLFLEIFNITEKVKNDVIGLGNLWSYDTALRIGFNLKVYPNEVYVQSGVIKGVKKIFNENVPAGRSLPADIFPLEVQVLEPYEIENFMCIWGKNSLKKSC